VVIDPGRGGPRTDLAITVMAARRYYLDGATKSEIATELGVSRFRVARLLEGARRRGIVRIEIAPAPGIDAVISHDLATAYGIRSAIVVQAVGGPPEFTRTQLGSAAAGLVAETVEASDVLGISWGRTLRAMVEQLPQLPACTVVQLVGSVPSMDLDMNALELVRRMTVRGAGSVFPLHVPLIVDTAETAARLRDDPHAAQTFRTFPQVTRAIVGIGAWSAGESTLRLGGGRGGDRPGRRRRRRLLDPPRRLGTGGSERRPAGPLPRHPRPGAACRPRCHGRRRRRRQGAGHPGRLAERPRPPARDHRGDRTVAPRR
jgi:DNA-binding transcriptional regulator LsrR (DeoR family)